MILGAVHRSPGIYLTAEKNPRKPQLGGGCATSHHLKWALLLLYWRRTVGTFTYSFTAVPSSVSACAHSQLIKACMRPKASFIIYHTS